ncbi:MAG: PaaI family thioesterase [Verrucomicrobia bacterium]|nr:PaaI family thioesterase [Verrucomicrobiota bacterium]
MENWLACGTRPGIYWRAMQELPHTHSCFVCGESNASGLRLRFETDGRLVQTRFTVRPEHIGFKGVMHGGLIATVLDEIMVWACAVGTRQFAYCAEFTVRFLNPVRPGELIIAEAELAENRKNRIFQAQAVLRDETGGVRSRATGKYLPLKTEAATEMAADFVGDTRWILDAGLPLNHERD